VRGTDLGERLPIDFGTFTCSCGEGIGDGHSKLEELIVGDLNKGVKWLVNVLRSVDGEFGRMEVEDVAEGIKLGDELAGLRLDHGPDSENFDLRLFEASSLGVIFDFLVRKGFTYSARYISPDVRKGGGDGSVLTGYTTVGCCC
jgi:hypothetical protein